MIPNIQKGVTRSDLDEVAVAARERVKNSDADVLMAEQMLARLPEPTWMDRVRGIEVHQDRLDGMRALFSVTDEVSSWAGFDVISNPYLPKSRGVFFDSNHRMVGIIDFETGRCYLIEQKPAEPPAMRFHLDPPYVITETFRFQERYGMVMPLRQGYVNSVITSVGLVDGQELRVMRARQVRDRRRARKAENRARIKAENARRAAKGRR